MSQKPKTHQRHGNKKQQVASDLLKDILIIIVIISIWVTIRGGLVTRYRTKIKFLDFLCSSDCSSIFFRIFSLIPNNASLQEVV